MPTPLISAVGNDGEGSGHSRCDRFQRLEAETGKEVLKAKICHFSLQEGRGTQVSNDGVVIASKMGTSLLKPAFVIS